MGIDVLALRDTRACLVPRTGGIYVSENVSCSFKVGGSGVHSFDRNILNDAYCFGSWYFKCHGIAGLNAAVSFC